MNFITILKIYAITLLTLCLIDIPWILLIAKQFYQNQIGHLMKTNPELWPAVIFYTCYAAALIIFAILPGIEKQSLWYCIQRAAFLGFICYSAYDLTNQATLYNWPLTMTIVDISWGTFMSTLVAGISYTLSK